jgi:hypothetical protein
MLPDFRHPRVKEEFFLKLKTLGSGIDQDSATYYNKINFDCQKLVEESEKDEETKASEDEEEESFDPLLYDYIFLIDRSGSMSG